jgi:hypothetical protein
MHKQSNQQFLAPLTSFLEAKISDVHMKSWAGKALDTVNCFAFLKRKLTVVIRVF